MSEIEALFGPDGPFSRVLGQYERRDGQIAMAEAVTRALADDRMLLCEAGTGTGTTLAYRGPALLSRKKVIISTATRALQQQIYSKDLPIVAAAPGHQPRVALTDGLANSACRRRVAEFRSSAEALRPAHARGLSMLESFVCQSSSGDLAELLGLAEDDPLRFEAASSSD